MPMLPRLLLDGEAAATLKRLIAWSEAFGFAVAWASENPVLSCVVRYASKLRCGVVGTHFYQTQPASLRLLAGIAAARAMSPRNELFHPKVWWFTRQGTARCVVGSHNLTRAAHQGGNVEASLLIECDGESEFARSLQRFVIGSWKRASPIEEPFLTSYELQWEATRRSRRALTEFVELPPMSSAERFEILGLAWSDFVQGVQADPHHSVHGRLAVLEAARKIFATKGSFAKMTRDERRAIAGVYGRREETLGGHDWAWFGTMFGHGDFKHLVHEDFRRISKALDHIPLVGDVGEEMYRRYARGFLAAFEGASHQGGLATASRLLAMKRPDWFIAMNRANQASVCKAFGVPHTTTNIVSYWDRIIRPMHLTPWWRSPRPNDPFKGRIWDCRAALLDSHYYEPI